MNKKYPNEQPPLTTTQRKHKISRSKQARKSRKINRK